MSEKGGPDLCCILHPVFLGGVGGGAKYLEGTECRGCESCEEEGGLTSVRSPGKRVFGTKQGTRAKPGLELRVWASQVVWEQLWRQSFVTNVGAQMARGGGWAAVVGLGMPQACTGMGVKACNWAIVTQKPRGPLLSQEQAGGGPCCGLDTGK